MAAPHLEETLSQRPYSPLFARLAGRQLAEGRADNARTLCTAGLKDYPDYASAHLILARCHTAEGRYASAIESLYRAMAILPDSSVLRGLMIEWHRRIVAGTVQTGDIERSEVNPPEGTWDDEGRIVSKTLAEIYATQGAFDEAITTYRLLKRKKPVQTLEFDQRISELEIKLQAKLAQQQQGFTSTKIRTV